MTLKFITLQFVSIAGLLPTISAFIPYLGKNKSLQVLPQTETPSQFSSQKKRCRFNCLNLENSQRASDVIETLNEKISIDETKKPKISSTPSIAKITTSKEFIEFLEEDDRICIIKFHATWCQICRSVRRKFAKFALTFGDRAIINPVSTESVLRGRVRFAEVEWSENVELCKALNVKKFPFIMMYERREKIGAFSTGPAHNFRNIVGKTIEEKLAMSESEKEEFRLKFAANIAEGMADLEAVKALSDESVGSVQLQP